MSSHCWKREGEREGGGAGGGEGETEARGVSFYKGTNFIMSA